MSLTPQLADILLDAQQFGAQSQLLQSVDRLLVQQLMQTPQYPVYVTGVRECHADVVIRHYTTRLGWTVTFMKHSYGNWLCFAPKN